MGNNVPAITWDPGKFEFQRKLGNFVQYFQVNMPTNAYGIPLKLVNPTTIAENMLDCQTTDDMPDNVLDLAEMSVDFEEGMPVVDGLPIWERFDGEVLDYYKFFKEYRDMLYFTGSRSIAKLSAKHNIVGKNLNAISKVYHWALRCRAYDLYKKTERERLRQYEIEKLESKHMRASEVLLERGLAYIENHPEQLNPKVALQMIQVAMKAGRLSLGLNGEKPGTGDHVAGASIQINTTTTGTGDITVTTEVNGSQESQPDVSYLQSIVHILDKSGALDKAKSEIIDAEYIEVEDPEAVEGA